MRAHRSPQGRNRPPMKSFDPEQLQAVRALIADVQTGLLTIRRNLAEDEKIGAADNALDALGNQVADYYLWLTAPEGSAPRVSNRNPYLMVELTPGQRDRLLGIVDEILEFGLTAPIDGREHA